jgi:hypothetical protein
MNFKVAVTNAYPNDARSVSQMILPFMILQNNKGQNHKDMTFGVGRKEAQISQNKSAGNGVLSSSKAHGLASLEFLRLPCIFAAIGHCYPQLRCALFMGSSACCV